MKSPQAWRVLPCFLLLLALTFPVPPIAAEDEGGVLAVDAPLNAHVADLGQAVVFEGWAVNWTGPDTGVDRVVVVDAPLEAGGQIIAEAAYGGLRADVAAEHGEEWANSAFQATWMAAGPTGVRTFWIYAHSVADDSWTNKMVTIRITEASVGSEPAAPAPAARQNRSNGRNTDPSTNSAGQVRNPITGLFVTPNTYPYGTPQGSQPGGQYGNPYASYGPYGQCGNQYNALTGPNSNQLGQPDPYNGYNNMVCVPYSQVGSQPPNGQVGNQYPNGQVGNQYPYNQVGNQASYSQGSNPAPYSQVTNQPPLNQGSNQYPYSGAPCYPGQYGAQPPATGSSMGGSGSGYGCPGYSSSASATSGPTVVATAGADGTVALSWAAVASATQYRVYRVSPNNSLVATLAPTAGGATIMSTVVTGQAPGSVATYQVRAVGTNGMETAVAVTSGNSANPALVAPPQSQNPW